MEEALGRGARWCVEILDNWLGGVRHSKCRWRKRRLVRQIAYVVRELDALGILNPSGEVATCPACLGPVPAPKPSEPSVSAKGGTS